MQAVVEQRPRSIAVWVVPDAAWAAGTVRAAAGRPVRA